jgi:hypothetical protein
MFVYSMRATTVRFFGVICVALLVLVALIALVPPLQPVAASGEPESEAPLSISYEHIRTNEDRVAFLAQFGWEVEQTPLEETTATVPTEFDKVFAAYNELQREQGFDLSKYRKKTVTRYTYTLKNFENEEGTVYVNLIIYRNRVIGADICSADVSGFICGLEGREG